MVKQKPPAIDTTDVQRTAASSNHSHCQPDMAVPSAEEHATATRSLPHRTDAGNAELFARLLRDTVRFDHRRKRWMIWTRHWWREDRNGRIRRLAKSVVRMRMQIAYETRSGDELEAEIKWAVKSENRSRLDAMLVLAEAEHLLADSGDEWDSDPWLLGVGNGVVDLRTGALRPGRPEDRITMHTEVPFEPVTAAPRWIQFLDEVFDDNRELIDFIQRAVGSSLTGITSDQCFFACWGAGSNGKTTLLEIVRTTLGDYAYNAPFSMLELSGRSSIPNDVAALVNRRLVTGSETSELSRWNEQRVKALTGSDELTCRFLYHELFSFTPIAKFWLAFNHKPLVDDNSHGFWRRVRLIPFLHRFEGDKADNDLMKKLRAEASGILAWAVEGCLRWQKEGLGTPPAIKKATDEYRQECDIVGQFLDERCVIGADARISAADLWQEFTDWCQQNGERMERRAFVNRLEDKGFKRARVRHDRTRTWLGLG